MVFGFRQTYCVIKKPGGIVLAKVNIEHSSCNDEISTDGAVVQPCDLLVYVEGLHGLGTLSF